LGSISTAQSAMQCECSHVSVVIGGPSDKCAKLHTGSN